MALLKQSVKFIVDNGLLRFAVLHTGIIRARHVEFRTAIMGHSILPQSSRLRLLLLYQYSPQFH